MIVRLLIVLNLLIISTSSFAQQGHKTITGTVLDSDGYPLLGCIIYPQNNIANGTITDFDGNFTLEVPEDITTLVVSFIGYRVENIKISEKPNWTIRLQEEDYSMGLPCSYNIRSRVSFDASTSVQHQTFGYSFGMNVSLPYVYKDCRQKNTIYDIIKSKTSIGLKINKTYPQQKEIQSSIGFRHPPLDWIKNNSVFTSYKYSLFKIIPYIGFGLYIHSDGSEIKSQNLEYVAGISMPIVINNRRLFEINTGYQWYNKNKEYNNYFLGIRYTLPLTPIIYY